MPMDTITVYLDFLIALFIFVNHVDRLLDISQNDVAVAIVGLETASTEAQLHRGAALTYM